MPPRWTRILLVLLTCSLSDPGPSDQLAAGDLTREINVSWDFGSGPGRTSNFYVGERTIPVRYDKPECMSRFTLERARYELSDVKKDGRSVREGPPFIMLILRKHFAGDFELLPRVTITQNEADGKGGPTGRKVKVTFPFREKKMTAPVADWLAAEIDVTLGAPGAIMNLHNPLDWSGIEIGCD